MREDKPVHSEKVKTVFRTVKNAENPFVMIDRRPIENPSLSWKAKGVFAYLLSRPDNWTVRLGDLVKRSPDGISAVRGAINELKAAGHVRRVEHRDPVTKRITEYVLEVYELPFTSKPLTTFLQAENLQAENLTLNDIDLNETELKNIGASAPPDLGLEWKLTHNQKVSQHDLDLQKEAEYRNSAGLIATGMGINSMVAFDIALSFMQARQIVIPESKVKGQRKAVKEMIQSRVSGEHVKQAVKKLIEENMTIVDLFSVSRTACDLANPKPESKKPEGGRSSERLDR
jgi:hypothetical protein